MVDWESANTFFANKRMAEQLVYCIMGQYIWEVLTTIGFDLDFILRRRKFNWSISFYFLNRYTLLAHCIFTCLVFNTPKYRYVGWCRAVYSAAIISGAMSRGFSSINLALRTIAIWSFPKVLILGLSLLMLGQWVIIFINVGLSHAAWIAQVGCFDMNTDVPPYALFFAYVMGCDLIFLILIVYKLGFDVELLRQSPKMRDPFLGVIFRQGLYYHISAFLADLAVVVTLSLQLNFAVSSMFVFPAWVVTSTAACRAVRSLATTGHSSAIQETVNLTTVEFRSYEVASRGPN